MRFQHTAARRRLGHYRLKRLLALYVSTHSRPKAAGRFFDTTQFHKQCFNTQPPEGGWGSGSGAVFEGFVFQHTAARRRLVVCAPPLSGVLRVSTHSRPKAAGWSICFEFGNSSSFNTQPPEGGWQPNHVLPARPACFNTQPPEGGWDKNLCTSLTNSVSTHSRPKAAGKAAAAKAKAAEVSTHSRPKAAGHGARRKKTRPPSFNTQPPEGGWIPLFLFQYKQMFQHTAARRRLEMFINFMMFSFTFQHTAARRRLDRLRHPSASVRPFQHTAARRRLEPLSKALLHQASQPRFR